jgi:hypothetical protein
MKILSSMNRGKGQIAMRGKKRETFAVRTAAQSTKHSVLVQKQLHESKCMASSPPRKVATPVAETSGLWARNYEKLADSPVQRSSPFASFMPGGLKQSPEKLSYNIALPVQKVVVEEVGWEGTQETPARLLSTGRLSKRSVQFCSSVPSLPSYEAPSNEKEKEKSIDVKPVHHHKHSTRSSQKLPTDENQYKQIHPWNEPVPLK